MALACGRLSEWRTAPRAESARGGRRTRSRPSDAPSGLASRRKTDRHERRAGAESRPSAKRNLAGRGDRHNALHVRRDAARHEQGDAAAEAGGETAIEAAPRGGAGMNLRAIIDSWQIHTAPWVIAVATVFVVASAWFFVRSLRREGRGGWMTALHALRL